MTDPRDASIACYTPRDYHQLITDAKVDWTKDIATTTSASTRPPTQTHYPNVDVYAEKGSGIPTVVGARLDNLTSGQVVTPATTLLTRDGDGNQYITNNAVLAWRTMRCSHFSLTDNPGVDHFALPSNPYVLHRLLVNVTPTRQHNWASTYPPSRANCSGGYTLIGSLRVSGAGFSNPDGAAAWVEEVPDSATAGDLDLPAGQVLAAVLGEC